MSELAPLSPVALDQCARFPAKDPARGRVRATWRWARRMQMYGTRSRLADVPRPAPKPFPHLPFATIHHKRVRIPMGPS